MFSQNLPFAAAAQSLCAVITVQRNVSFLIFMSHELPVLFVVTWIYTRKNQTQLALYFDLMRLSTLLSMLNWTKEGWKVSCGSATSVFTLWPHRTWILCFKDNTVGVGTGEMAQCLTAHTILAGDLRSFPSIYIGCPWVRLLGSDDLLWTLVVLPCRHSHTGTHTSNLNTKVNRNKHVRESHTTKAVSVTV